jgi:hypothetical protein
LFGRAIEPILTLPAFQLTVLGEQLPCGPRQPCRRQDREHEHKRHDVAAVQSAAP